MTSLAQYYQALADDDANSHGVAISRLQVAETVGKEANKLATSFPGNVPVNSNLTSETGSALAEITKRHLNNVQEKLYELIKDNDYIYHQTVPAEAALSVIPKLPAAKAIPVSELYAGQDIQRITGPDIFQKIVPMSVTESASLYDEEKAKLVRAETERVETANSEMAASLDYLRLPGALQVLKGGFDQEPTADDEYRGWCEDVGGHEPPPSTFDFLKSSKEAIITVLDRSSKQLDMEESVCEKMRSKYEGEWTQQPSSRLTTTLRSDIRNYREALEEAARSDSQLYSKMRQHEIDFDEMRSAGETGEADVLFQKALVQVGGKSKNVGSPVGGEGNLLDEDFGDGGVSVMDQIAKVEEILKKLNLIKRERAQVLKDLKEKVCFSIWANELLLTMIQVHNDDISQVLILNKKSISNYEAQLFQAELEKFRPHQNRLLSANHKQSSLMKELTATFNALLQDKRVRSEQSKYENITRQRSAVMSKYKRVYQEFLDLEAGLQSAKQWYNEMKDTVDSLDKNVETFVNNRRSEGAQLLSQIEQERAANATGQADRERERLRGLMERMSMDPSPTANKPPRSQSVSYNSTSPSTRYPTTNFAGQYQVPNSPPPQPAHPQSAHPAFAHNGGFYSQTPQSRPDAYAQKPAPTPLQLQSSYNPSAYPQATSPPPTQTSFSQNQYARQATSPPPTQTTFSQNQYGRAPHQQSMQQGYIPPGYIPPPPPPGPPPLGPQQTFQQPGTGEYGYGSQQPRPPQQNSADPWAGLNAWK